MAKRVIPGKQMWLFVRKDVENQAYRDAFNALVMDGEKERSICYSERGGDKLLGNL
jgi:hypothetical protein